MEDIEEAIYEGEKQKLFSVTINYEHKSLRINHINKGHFDNNQIDNLKKKLASLKSKLTSFVGTIDSLSA
jgi:hypothetical protein